MQQLLFSPKDLGVIVRDLRKEKGLTQSELGQRVGLDQKKVSLIENGNPNVRLDSFFRLLSALEVGIALQSREKAENTEIDEW